MTQEIDKQRLTKMRKRIMDLERTNAYTDQYGPTQMQKKIQDIIEEEAFDDN